MALPRQLCAVPLSTLPLPNGFDWHCGLERGAPAAKQSAALQRRVPVASGSQAPFRSSQIRRPNNYEPDVCIMLGPPDADPTMDLTALDIVKTVVLDSPNKLFVGGLPCDWTEEQVGRWHHNAARPNRSSSRPEYLATVPSHLHEGHGLRGGALLCANHGRLCSAPSHEQRTWR
jgi:hypothetical protein